MIINPRFQISLFQFFNTNDTELWTVFLNDYALHFLKWTGKKDDVIDTNWLC